MKNKVNRKKMRKEISGQLHVALSALKEQLGEKRFEKRIKKAAKMLTSGIKKNSQPKPASKAKKATTSRKKVAEVAVTNS